MPAPFLAACVQMRGARAPAANIDQAVRLVREAAEAGARYVQTPEMSNAVNRDRAGLLASLSEEAQDPMLAAFRALARERRIHLHAGSLAIRLAEDRVANRAFLIDPEGEVAASYDKIHLFDVDLPGGESWRESRTFAAGGRAVVADLVAEAAPLARLGLAICYDLRFPALFRALAEAGADLLGAPACFTRQTGEAHWTVLQRARAIETGAYMVSAAQGGRHDDGRETYGHSMIVDPWGRVLAEAGDEPGIILAEISPDAVRDARARIPALRHARPFAVEVAAAPSGARRAATC